MDKYSCCTCYILGKAVTIVLSLFEATLSSASGQAKSRSGTSTTGHPNGQSKEQHHPHDTCHRSSARGLSGIFSKPQVGVFSLYTAIIVQTKTSWLLSTVPALLHTIQMSKQGTSMSLALNHLPSHLKTVKPSENVTKVGTAAHNIQHRTKTKAEKRQSNGITRRISCEVYFVANNGDKRSGFTI